MTLSLSMIVKNESEVLGRALETARIYADEIVVVDTGSTDDTVEIAKNYTDRVYTYDWCDDFAAARNFALSKCTGDYWMWLDADDRVPFSTAKSLARYFRKLDRGTDIVMLPYVLETDSFGKPIYSFYRERIIRNRPDFVWFGRVHEAVALHGNIVRAPYSVLHAKPENRATGTRNLDIYKKMISGGARLEPRELYYYARELYHNNEISAAADAFTEFIKLPNGFAANKIDACLMSARCYSRMGDKAAAYGALFDSFRYGLPTGEVCCEIALTFFADNDYKSAAYWFERAARSKPDIDSGAFVDLNYYDFLPFVWLTVCYDKLGKTRAAYRWHCRARKIRPDHPSVVANQAYFESLGY